MRITGFPQLLLVTLLCGCPGEDEVHTLDVRCTPETVTVGETVSCTATTNDFCIGLRLVAINDETDETTLPLHEWAGCGELAEFLLVPGTYTVMVEQTNSTTSYDGSRTWAKVTVLSGAEDAGTQDAGIEADANILDAGSACSSDAGEDRIDTDRDGMDDACDEDDDDDGVSDEADNCPRHVNPSQDDVNEDGVGDTCGDDDGDDYVNPVDNCPSISNPDQRDVDSDGLGDRCDNDADGDGIEGALDNCWDRSNPDQADTDADLDGDACDDDDDNDGVLDENDNCSTVANSGQEDADADGEGDLCEAPSSSTLTVRVFRAGRVQSTPSGIDCANASFSVLTPLICDASFSSHSTVVFTATPDAGFGFNAVTWTGCDTATGLTCSVSVVSGRTVDAYFYDGD